MTKTNDNAKAIARANSAFDIAVELENIVASIIENGGECDDATMTSLTEWKAAIEIKGHSICMVKARLESEMEHFAKIEKLAQSKKNTRKNAIDRLKKYLADVMAMTNTKSIKSNDGLFSVSLQKGKAKAKIDNVDLLPEKYVSVRTDKIPDKKLLKEALEALKDGEEIAGAELEYGDDYIVIR